MTYQVARHGSVSAAMAWMIGLSAALFWLPFLGGLVAGFVGGRKAGTVGNAVAAVVLPGILLWLFTFFFGGVLGWIPVLGQLATAIAGLGAFALSFMNLIPLLIGAVIGAATR